MGQAIFFTGYAAYGWARHAVAMNRAGYLPGTIAYYRRAEAVRRAARKIAGKSRNGRQEQKQPVAA